MDQLPRAIVHAACEYVILFLEKWITVHARWTSSGRLEATGYRPVRTYLRRSSRLEARPPTCGVSQPNAYVASGAGATLKCGTCPDAVVDGSPSGQARSRRQFLLPPSSSSSQRRCYISRLPLLRADPLSSATARLLFPRVEMAAVNLLAESAAVRLRAPAPPGAGEELAARLTECGFPTTARRGGVVAGLGRARASGGRWRSGRRNSYCGAGAESRGRSSRFAAARMRPTSCTRSVSMSATERFLDLLHNPYVKCGIATTALFGLGRGHGG
uniref:Uncharacterized protein n=2 Tax=Zea mays TaxID=4577 RepID=A0A804PXH5_MAIZE